MRTINYAYFYGELKSFPLCDVPNASPSTTRLQVLLSESKRFNAYIVGCRVEIHKVDFKRDFNH